MPAPFLYPQKRIARGADPGPYSDYKRYKQHLRSLFGRQCAYCCAPDDDNTAAFQIDHYRPQAARTGAIHEYQNLFYCCARCNRAKGDFWPSDLLRRFDQFIVNPCDHIMTSYLKFDGISVVPIKAAGHWTEAFLFLNDSHRLKQRRKMLEIIELARSSRSALSSKLKKVEDALSRETDPEKAIALQSACEQLSAKIATAKSILHDLCAA